MRATAHAKGALVLAEDLDNCRDILSTLGQHHAPRRKTRVGRVVGVEPSVVTGILRRVNLALEAGLLGQNRALLQWRVSITSIYPDLYWAVPQKPLGSTYAFALGLALGRHRRSGEKSRQSQLFQHDELQKLIRRKPR